MGIRAAEATQRSFDSPALVLFIAGFKDGFTHSWAARNFLLREGAFILPELWPRPSTVIEGPTGERARLSNAG